MSASTSTDHSLSSEEFVQLQKAVEQFNNKAFYACHETLEELWLADKSSQRDVYKGILQIAVALFHMERNNIRGAMRLLESGTGLIRSFEPEWSGLDTQRLGSDSRELLNYLATGGDIHDPAVPVPTIHWVGSSLEKP
ncbi:DUF309 domain-containing protein [Desulfonatronovibrio hydrogenovorans]|uniref:DUF309 domain-containing protein n=1 Tax=Desulfonatronovibrio hydrogenovorans TaxID=53245 RepID=UPI001376B3BE|nr:DUF309 domain-containing protein [Desulfonatronovibrio hydrogenovorans]